MEKTTVKIVKIRKNIKTAQSSQKSYADTRRRDFEFGKDDQVFLKVTTFKGISRFGKMGKLNLRLIGPFKILNKISTAAYRLALPPKLSMIHNVFHVCILRKYNSNPSHILAGAPFTPWGYVIWASIGGYYEPKRAEYSIIGKFPSLNSYGRITYRERPLGS